MTGRLLGIYLNDQLAAGILWREVARRAARNNRGTDTGQALGGVAAAIAEDVETFKGHHGSPGRPEERDETALAIAAERAGRLKLNGRLTSYSPLSWLVELDFLAMGIEGKEHPLAELA